MYCLKDSKCGNNVFSRASDKRRNIAAQKAEAQRRLFRSHKKVDLADLTEGDKKKQSIEKRKDELVGDTAQLGILKALNLRFKQGFAVVAQFSVAVLLCQCL